MSIASCRGAARGAVQCLLLLWAASAAAQIPPPNAAGVAMGQLKYAVTDLAATRAFWLALGGTAVPAAGRELIALPGLLIVLREGAAAHDPAVVDHVAFRVASLADIEARGFTLQRYPDFPGIASLRTPDGAHVELFEEGTAINIGFDTQIADHTAQRHNRPLVGAIASHHLHFMVPEDQVTAARDWYVRQFGAVPGVRWHYLAADLPGMNLNFSAPEQARAPTRGQGLERIGFEVADLEAFCRRLEADGIVFEQPYRRLGPALATAVLTDPWGVTIELSEGLGRHGAAQAAN